MTSGIDYSKWDKFDASSSEEEEEKILPRVTKLDSPGTVTRSADGTITLNPRTDDDAILDAKKNIHSKNDMAESPSSSLTSHNTRTKKIEFVKEKKVLKRETLVRNGGQFRDQTLSFWSQDRNEVILSVTFNPQKISPRNIKVKVVGILPFSERYSAVGWNTSDDKATPGSLTVFTTSDTSTRPHPFGNSLGTQQAANTLITGVLPHFVHLSEGEEEVEWEVDDCENFGIKKSDFGEDTKLIRITLRKAVPTTGISVWWSQPLLHWPKLDVSQIKDRGENSKKQDEIKKSWDEAHRLFKEKISSRERNVVNIDSGQE